MKKCISVLVLLALASAGAFAQMRMSYGGGLLFDMSEGNGLYVPGIYIERVNNISIGGFAFYDATYVEVSAYFSYGIVEWSELMLVYGSTDDVNFLQLGFSLLGKFPIGLGSISIFPMAGISYNMVLSAYDEVYKYANASDFSQLGFLFGAGLDYDLTDSMFIRAAALFQIRLASKLMDEGKTIGSLLFPDIDTTLGLGPQIKVGVGFRL